VILLLVAVPAFQVLVVALVVVFQVLVALVLQLSLVPSGSVLTGSSSDSGGSVDLEEWRQVRREQDIAYQDSLGIDQEKARKKADQEQKKKVCMIVTLVHLEHWNCGCLGCVLWRYTLGYALCVTRSLLLLTD
jgi:hypothetical protein